MSETLRDFHEALRARDAIRERVQSLRDQRPTEDSRDRKLEAKLQRQTDRLSALEQHVAQLRHTLARETDQARAAVATAEEAQRALAQRHRAGEVSGEAYRAQESALREQLENAEARLAQLGRAVTAESASELDRLNAELATETETTLLQKRDAMMQRYSQSRFADWPGAPVPERLAMLWREGKKPQAKRPILISAAVVGALALIIIGTVLVAGASRERDITDFLGHGEVLVPVLVDQAEGVRDLRFTIEYDADLLTGISVIQGDVGRLAVMQYDIDHAGIMTVTIRDVGGVSGSGPIIVARFRAKESVDRQTPLTFTSVSATDVRTSTDMLVHGENGWINTNTLDVQSPVLDFTPP